MKTIKVKIDGKENTLTFVYSNGNSYQYNTEGNKAAHTFSSREIERLPKGTKFKTNGCNYEIL